MSSSFFRVFLLLLILIFLFYFLFICCFFIVIPSDVTWSNTIPSSFETLFLNSSNFIWPTPGYTTITSKFGKRNRPTAGASTSHSGIDIGAPTGASILSITNAEITYLGFSGAGGYTITTKQNNLSISYCHVSPNFLITVGQYVKKGEVIGNVGPFNVYGVSNNPYRDSQGRPTNGATTGPHLHITIKKDGIAVNPLDYLYIQ